MLSSFCMFDVKKSQFCMSSKYQVQQKLKDWQERSFSFLNQASGF